MAKFNALKSNSVGVSLPKINGRVLNALERSKQLTRRSTEKASTGKRKINPLRLNSGGQYRR